MNTTYAFDERLFLWTGTILYCTAFAYSKLSVSRRRRNPRLGMLGLVSGGFLIQTVGLYLRGLEVGSCPIGNPFERLQFISWSAILLYLLIGPAFRVSLLGFFTAGFAAVLGLASLCVPTWDLPYAIFYEGSGAWIETHAATAVFSYGIFGILALTALMYLIQNHGLRKRRTQGIFAVLPSIVQLDQMNARLLLTGVTVLTFSMGVGALQWHDNWGQLQMAKLIATTMIWLAYCATLVLHRLNRLITRKFAWSCLALFALAILSLWPLETGRDQQTSRPVAQP